MLVQQPPPKEKSAEFHTNIAKGLFTCKPTRPDIHYTIAYICTLVKKPRTKNWKNIIRIIKYLNGTRKYKLFLSVDNLHVINCYVDASFAVHSCFKNYTKGVMTLGGSAIEYISHKKSKYLKQH